jgi:hypothetical protein
MYIAAAYQCTLPLCVALLFVLHAAAAVYVCYAMAHQCMLRLCAALLLLLHAAVATRRTES